VSASLLLLLPLLLVVPLGLVVVVLVAASARPDHTLSRELVSARRHGVTTSVVAVLLQGLALALTPFSPGIDDARVAAVLPLTGSAMALVALLVGELTWPRPRGATRTALIHDRSVAMLLRGRWATTALVAGGLLLGTLLVGGWLGQSSSSDAAIARSVVQADGSITETAHGPFPGWAYGAPQLVAGAAVAALLLLVLRAATNRATVVTADLDTDLLLRRASAARAFRAAAFGALVTAGADLVVGGGAARNVASGLGDAAALSAVLLGVGCIVAALVVVLVPAHRLPRTPVPAQADRVSA